MTVRIYKKVFVFTALGIAAAGVVFLVEEARHFRLQAHLLSDIGQQISYRVEPGASQQIRFGGGGPYDQRLGYSALPDYIQRLQADGYVVSGQARQSPQLLRIMDMGLFAPYREKTQAGLSILDCRNDPLYAARYPERVFNDFDAVPRVLVESLLFIENRELLDESRPRRNPAVEWDRFARALFDQLVHAVYPGHEAPGGSTLATQIEKYRHSPQGRTIGAREKLRQMSSASLRAYLDGEETLETRRRIVLDYLNTVPLSARPGRGEVNGLGDALWAWYGRNLQDVGDLPAAGDERPGQNLEDKALAYKQALSLMIAQRRPSYYLSGNGDELEAHANVYLRLLADAGIITPAVRDAALARPIVFRAGGAERATASFASRKAANAVRVGLAAQLGVAGLYELDRLDLVAHSTLNADLQQAVTARLEALRDPAVAKAAGLIGFRLLDHGDPAKLVYSFTLFERTPGANLVRVQADNFEQPLDINNGSKLDLGSTAKLRTLLSYLSAVAELHERLGGLGVKELRALPVHRQDAITAWAVDYLAKLREKGAGPADLRPMLDAAMERQYSANPGEGFFTGGGLHHFDNFDAADNGRIVSVREAVRRSINLPFIRLMRDVVRYAMFAMPSSSPTILDDVADPQRKVYLARFADREGREFLHGFIARYRGLSAEDALQQLLKNKRPTPVRLAVVFRSLEPGADEAEFAAFLRHHLPAADESKDKAKAEAKVARLYRDYAPDRFNLNDRGYLAGVHPLELWLLGYLRQHPQATTAEIFAASRDERQEAYEWLFKPRKKGAQDARIKVLIEEDAFREIHRGWKRLGYPFDSLVPSYATALGSSADRPGALAELMGILLNDGVRLPTVRVESLLFAAGTPYETELDYRPGAPQRVLPAEVAQVARQVLSEVIENGTAARLKGVFRQADGSPLTVGGKTGTGDHRFETFAKGGALLSSRVVERSGTFVFYLGDRHFGTLTAYVGGPDAADYRFTSSLPVQILKVLAPALEPATRGAEGAGQACRRPPSRAVMAQLEALPTGGPPEVR